MASSTGTGAGVFQTSPTITTPVISSLSSASATALTLQSAGTTAITVDTSQNVGIGTTSPGSKLYTQLSSATAYSSGVTGNGLTIYNSNTTTNQYVGITLQGEPTTGNGGVATIMGTTTGSGNMDLTFSTRGSATLAERMRIDSSGNVLIGQTTGNADARTSINGGSTDSSPCIDYKKNSSTTTTAQVYARFTANATGTGSITANGAAAAAFTAWSDRRLKENITDLPSQLANIMALRPVEFDYVESMGGGHQIGFIAQDVQAIYPDLVGESADGMLTLTDMNKNDARLIKAIQELKAINDTQAATINALTARIVALENK
jgi:hypothetical protein